MHPWIQQKVTTKFDQALVGGAIENLKSFTAQSKLKQASLTYMVTHLATKQEQQRIKDTFN